VLRAVADWPLDGHGKKAVLENARTLRRKLRWVAQQRLAGVFVWRLEHDDFDDQCGRGAFPFARQVRDELVALHCQEQPRRCQEPDVDLFA